MERIIEWILQTGRCLPVPTCFGLIASSIVAISSIHLLKAFMSIQEIPNDKLLWLVVIHMTFVVSALLMAVIERYLLVHHGGDGT